MPTPSKKMAAQIRRVLTRTLRLEKRVIFRQETLKLYPSEIHLLQVIAEEAGLSAGAMAKRLGITVGAVSQTLHRLEQKGMIIKTKNPSLKNKLTATLTKSGQRAFRRFEEEQETSLKAFSSYLGSLTGKDRRIIEGFLTQMEEFLKSLG
jgi:DNA-binding MarR family transcriptional regulator